MPFFRGLFTMKKLFSSASAERRKTEEDCYLKNGSCVLEEFLALCDGNCRIPIRYFTATEIENAIRYSQNKLEMPHGDTVVGSLENRLVLVRFNRGSLNTHRDIAVTAQMSHLKNVLRLVGCCVEFEEPVMVYEYVQGKLQVQEDRVYGTYGYMAQEHAISGIITQKTDVYSFGILLFQLLTGKKVWDIMDNAMDSTYSNETTDFEEDATEEGNTLDRVDSVILEETIDIKNLPTNFVDRYIKEGNIMDIADPTILKEHGVEIQQQLIDYLDLVKKCTADNGDDRPYMIHVARELRRIDKCFYALTAHN